MPQKSDHQKQIDRLSALLKIACLKRDQYQRVRCGKPETKHPIHPDDFLDVSHMFAKGGRCTLLPYRRSAARLATAFKFQSHLPMSHNIENSDIV